MPVLEPPQSPGKESDPDELPFTQLREYVQQHGNVEGIQQLREETRSRLGQIKASWPSDWTYD